MAGRSDSMLDLTKLVRKATTILSVSSSDQNNDRSPQVSISSEPDHDPDSESADDDSGNLKRKLENMESIQETDGESEMINIIKNSDEISASTAKTCTNSSCTSTTDDQVASSARPAYACSLCSKTFTSHRALGGHKSSHNKFKMTICDAIDLRPKKQLLITNTCDQQIASSTGQSNIIAVGDHYRTHTCKICFEKFPSGQALGGHQRCHWTGNSTPADPNKTPKILDFDLNELSKEEDEVPSQIN